MMHGEPGSVARLRHALLAWLAAGLEVPVDRLAQDGWLRLFVRPPQHRSAGAFAASALRSTLKYLLLPAWRHTQCWLTRMNGSIDWHSRGELVERNLERLVSKRWLIVLLSLGGVLSWIAVATSPLSIGGRLQVFALTIAAALMLRRLPGRAPALLLAALSLLAMLRYALWRTTETLEFQTTVEGLAGYALLGAEAYTWLVVVFGFVQTAWPLHRKVTPMPTDPAQWPTVDVFIPTYNEPMSVVRPTVFAAQGMDWPTDKLRIYILDDGHRAEFEEFARDAGVGYLTRDDNKHAKAGNINRALGKTHGEYIAIFDCDHLPTRSFLQTTMGRFARDPKCALVQTPHHFFSPDPFERNLGTFRRVPNEGNLFYGQVQDANDLWNAAFFCGSCAVIKRSALERIGGIAVETVTEDAHTALKLHRLGYTSAYLGTVQAAGLATETLADHIKQRTRWGRGMAQIFRLDNPFLGRGLSFFQRLCYANAMLHFFYGVPRLIFLIMPMAYLFFGMYVITASAMHLASFVIPYMVLSQIANSRIQGKFRHSYWAEVYESVLAWYLALPTTVAFLSPKHGKFNVTDKGGKIDEGYFDFGVSKPYVILSALNALALIVGVVRLYIVGGDETPTILMNMFWAVYNLVMLGATIGVASETRQVRVTHRVAMRMPAMLQSPGGATVACETRDYSLGGMGFTVPDGVDLKPGDAATVCIYRGDRAFHFPVHIGRHAETYLGVRFDKLSLAQERELVQCTFGRADAWLDWHEDMATEAPLRGLKDLLHLGVNGYRHLWQGLQQSLHTRLRVASS